MDESKHTERQMGILLVDQRNTTDSKNQTHKPNHSRTRPSINCTFYAALVALDVCHVFADVDSDVDTGGL